MTLSVVLVVVVSFVGGELLHALASRRKVILSGAEYALFGVMLGPLVLGVLDGATLDVLRPAVRLLIGFVGFTMGLRLHELRTMPASEVLAAALLSLAIVAGVGAAAGALLTADGTPVGDAILPAVVIGGAAAVVSSRLHRAAAESLGADGPVIRSLRSVSITGSALAVMIAGVTMDWQRAVDSPALYDSLAVPPELWLAMGVLVGVICGILFALFQRGEHDEERTFLATIGVVIFASGIASALGSSPLLVEMVAGVTVSFVSPQADELRTQLRVLDRPATVALFVFAGALFSPLSGTGWLLPVVYVAVRAGSMFVGPRLVAPLARRRAHVRRLGAGMRSQGVIAVAIGVSLGLAYPEHTLVGDAVLIGVVVFEFGAGAALRRLLGDAGELGRVAAGEAA